MIPEQFEPHKQARFGIWNIWGVFYSTKCHSHKSWKQQKAVHECEGEGQNRG